MPLAFRAVHPDFRSRNGFIWPFPGNTATAAGPFTDTPGTGCPSHNGDGLCLALTARGAASGLIPLSTVLICEYDPSDVLGQEPDKIRVKSARVLSVHDFPATLRGETPHRVPLPTKQNLRSANLYGANLRSANLSGADLYGADLRSADLYGADLRSADLYGANLYGANLYGADLYGANLYGANLRSANLYGANLRSANLSGAVGDRWTRLPRGYDVSNDLIQRNSDKQGPTT